MQYGLWLFFVPSFSLYLFVFPSPFFFALSTFFSRSLLSYRLNFKDPEAVRALTCTLLKEDFGLSIEIPLERLIPTVPLRLNYIHWVEDLTGGQGSPRRGIDIGTPRSIMQNCVPGAKRARVVHDKNRLAFNSYVCFITFK